MTNPLLHPAAVLFAGSKPLPVIPAVDHYCGAEKQMRKALSLQHSLGPVFDITLDCEDGAVAGSERAHAEMVGALIASSDNHFGRIGARIHDITHPHWREDLELIVAAAGARLAFLTLPKPRGAADVKTLLTALREAESRHGLQREIPVHVLIETHGALHQVWQIAALPGVESIDFGLMDFVSEHQGAIGAAALKSPGQFEHPLIARAKADISAAAIAHAVIPTHNVTTALDDPRIAFEDARRAREQFGYLRMWSIHPNQIEPILQGMRPTANDVEDASLILAQAQDAQWGPIRVGTQLHDRGSFRHYWNLLLRARATGMNIPHAAEQRFFKTQSAN
ncbi:MAG: aldolase/citrate lyase family protein [Betaproteobacteria bacterium]|nr:aldolase/citrate lyase family protein [Betaproteobacteria bacterium]